MDSPDCFHISSGIKQGCVLALTLFGIFVTHTEVALQKLSNRFADACRRFDHTICLKMTNAMPQIVTVCVEKTKSGYDSVTLEVVGRFDYLPMIYLQQHPLTRSTAREG